MSGKALLSPKELALAIGVSESTIKRWADDGLVRVSRTLGGHRRILLGEALRFIRHNKATVVRPEMLGLTELETVKSDVSVKEEGQLGEKMYNALASGDGAKARGLMLSAYLGGRPLAWLFDGPIRQAMHRLGELWQHNEMGVLIEHRATDLCISAINQLRELVHNQDMAQEPSGNPPPPTRLLALGGAVEHDPYILPTLMAASVMAEVGYQTINFGPHTPVDVFIKAAKEYRPAIIWVSCSVRDHPNPVGDSIQKLADLMHEIQSHILLGGRGKEVLWQASHPHITEVQTMAQVMEFAQLRLKKEKTE